MEEVVSSVESTFLTRKPDRYPVSGGEDPRTSPDSDAFPLWKGES